MPTHSGLKLRIFIILQFLWVRSPTCLSWVLCSKPLKAAEKVATGLHSHLEAQVTVFIAPGLRAVLKAHL